MDSYSYNMDYNYDFPDRLVYPEGQMTPTIQTNQYILQYSLPHGSPPLGSNTHCHSSIMPNQPANIGLKRKRLPQEDDDLPLLSPSSTSSFSTTATTSIPKKKIDSAIVSNKVSKTSKTPNTSSKISTSQAAKNEKALADNDDDEEKLRMKNLERNRLAAYKCRQRKKEWIDELAHKAERMVRENEHLRQLLLQLKEEILYLKTQLIIQQENKQSYINHANQKI